MGIEVRMYNEATDELLLVFDSLATAAYENDLGRETVRKSCRGIKIKGGIYFREVGENTYTNRKTKVYWYDAKTNALLGVFDSALEAHYKTGIPVGTIRGNLAGRSKTVKKKQYYFRSPDIEYKPKNPEPYILKGKPKQWLLKKVDVYDTDDELVGTFDSFTDAAKFIGCNPNQISYNINTTWKFKEQGLIYKKYYCKLHKNE